MVKERLAATDNALGDAAGDAARYELQMRAEALQCRLDVCSLIRIQKYE